MTRTSGAPLEAALTLEHSPVVTTGVGRGLPFDPDPGLGPDPGLDPDCDPDPDNHRDPDPACHGGDPGLGRGFGDGHVQTVRAVRPSNLESTVVRHDGALPSGHPSRVVASSIPLANCIGFRSDTSSRLPT
jgi:hypothetical protein